jgi:hypothetical protein
LLQEVRCVTLLLHENRLARFAYLKRLSATLPHITQTGELIREGYAAWENSSVFARILRKLIPRPKRMELNLWTRRSKG